MINIRGVYAAHTLSRKWKMKLFQNFDIFICECSKQRIMAQHAKLHTLLNTTIFRFAILFAQFSKCETLFTTLFMVVINKK